MDAHGETPYYFNPLAAAAQLVNVSRPGEEPPLWEPYEDCRCVGGHASGMRACACMRPHAVLRAGTHAHACGRMPCMRRGALAMPLVVAAARAAWGRQLGGAHHHNRRRRRHHAAPG